MALFLNVVKGDAERERARLFCVPSGTTATTATAGAETKRRAQAGACRNRGDEKSRGAACQRRSALNGPVTAALGTMAPPPPNSAHSQNITTHLHTDSSRDIGIHSLVTLSCVGNVLSSHQTSRVIGRFSKILTLTTDSLNLMWRR